MNWQADYRRKIVPPQEAVRCIQSNMRVYIHPGCAEPEELVEALIARAPFVKNVEIVHLLTVGRADYIAPQMEGHFRHNAMFIGGNVRQAINEFHSTGATFYFQYFGAPAGDPKDGFYSHELGTWHCLE